MRIGLANNGIKAGRVLPCLLLCLSTAIAAADEAPDSVLTIGSVTLSQISGGPEQSSSNPESFNLLIDQDAGLDFDLAGSETRKLQLQLDQPLSLSMSSGVRAYDSGSNLLGLDATLDLPLSNSFSLTAGAERRLGEARFQSLGSIQCMNGVLRADSYTASGCRFINEPLATSDQQRFDLGARLDLGNASASINWFTQDSRLDVTSPGAFGQAGGQSVMGRSLLSPNLGNPLLAGTRSEPLSYLNSEASGVNLNFKVGIATDTRGDLRLGLAFSRVLDAGYDGALYNGAEALSWTIAEPFNTAAMNVEWSRGSFSTGIQGYYRDSVDFLDRNSLDSMTTFDVHFTWRTPWNANLSVGASNVMNAGADSAAAPDNQPVDPFESIYGRIPYVRYKQDL